MKKDCVLCSCLDIFRDFDLFYKMARLPLQIILELYSVRTETLFESNLMEAVALQGTHSPNELAIQNMQ